jgi:putative component of toxin-antitoxin plasmid stabilization module
MIEIRGYIAKVTIALTRMEQGNFSNVKAVGSGVFEYQETQ